MKDYLKSQFKKLFVMSTKERNILLCELSLKEHLNTILPHESIQLSIIQSIRESNGEIDAVLKSWKENPDLDPRTHN